MKQLIPNVRRLFLTLMMALLTSSAANASATIVIQNVDPAGVGFNDNTVATPLGGNPGTTVGQQRLNAFVHAANIWGQTLTSGPTITISASWSTTMTCTTSEGVLGSAGAIDFVRSFPGAAFSNTWYSVALANSLSGADLNGNTAEIRAQFNARVGEPGCLQNSRWYYGLDANNAFNDIDLVAVLLHELAHGLGFQTATRTDTGSQLLGFPTIFDRFLFDNSAGKSWVQMTNAERTASAINTGNLVWNGSQVNSDAVSVLSSGKDSLGRPQMYAPNPREGGSSVSHWDQIPIFPNQLMEPNLHPFLTHSVTPPQDLTFSLLRDIGWCAGCIPPPPPPPPANDNFANAQVITGCSGSVNGTNLNATKEPGEPSHVPGAGSRSVWYQWQAPATGSVTITTAGSVYDTVLAVYTGTSINALGSAVASNDDVGGTPHDVSSTVTFTANAGTVYRIAVDGFNNQGSGGDMGSITLNWTQSNCTAPSSTIQLSASSYQTAENAGSTQITVNRSDANAAATVKYATSDTAGLAACTVNNGIASERCDYATTVGTLRFAAGETTKSFIIPIVNDVHPELNENFTVTLSSSTGASLGSPSTATVSIIDNDSGTVPNIIDDIPFFVTQQYIDFLGRLPDQIGFQTWVNTLTGCPNGGFGEFDNPTCDRVHVSSGFYLSEEFRGRGYWAYRFYEVAFNTRPTYAQFVPDMAQVGGPQSPESEVLSKNQYTLDFVQRSEFITRYNGRSNADFVNDLEANAEVNLDNAALTAQLDGGKTRAQLLREIVESKAVEDKFFIRAFVAMQYFGYLRRDPDTDGYNGWVTTLTANPSDFRHMIFGFIYSDEYRRRFGL